MYDTIDFTEISNLVFRWLVLCIFASIVVVVDKWDENWKQLRNNLNFITKGYNTVHKEPINWCVNGL